jgi:uncharacterized protein YcfL
MKTAFFLLACIASALVLNGCRATSVSYQLQDTTKYSIENTQKFVRLDMATQAAIICTGLQEHFNDDGRLEVVANVKNRTNSRIQIRVRCVFKDVSGFAMGDETAWQLLALDDEATEAVRFTAINKLARKYTVVVRMP